MIDFKKLPVYQHRNEIINALKENQVIVVESPTGSGKTTQIPLILHEAGYTNDKIVGITQPRRVATLSVTEFIDRQLNHEDGFVGYKMRFNDTTMPNTKIKVMTDGILLMELKADPLLSKYSVMLVDEAHERSLNIDFVLGLLKNILIERDDFKVIVSSATINTAVFSQFFNNAPIISIDARVYPVNIVYSPLSLQQKEDEIYEKISDIVEKEYKKGDGDILIFLPGEFDIKMTLTFLNQLKISRNLLLLPLYGRLSKEEQEEVFIPTPEGKMKVVVATNIAETSITIENIKTVIDSGVAKINYYNQKNFTSSLVTLPISRSSCEQRAGRSGRTSAGTCYRLYTKEDFSTRQQFGLEEILRTDLSEVILRMAELEIYDWENFSFITRPKSSAIESAEETLKFIGAIDKNRKLTTIGEMMVRFPLLPRHSRVIVEAIRSYPQVLDEVIIAISFLSAKHPFLLPPGEEDFARKAHQKFNSQLGDFMTYLLLYRKWVELKHPNNQRNWATSNYLDYESMSEIFHISEQLREIVSEMKIPITSGGSTKEYLICLATGLLQYVCIKAERNMYRSLTATQIFLHPGSAWFNELPQFILAGEIVQTSRLYARTVSPLKKEWLDLIEADLRHRLISLQKPKKRVDKKEQRENGNTIKLFKRYYPLVNAPKGRKKVVIIPLEDLNYLAKSSHFSKKELPNTMATLSWQDHFIHYGDRLSSIVKLDNLLQLNLGILNSPPSGTFTSSDPNILIDNLIWILAFCKIKKRRNELGFIELNLHSNNVYRFAVNRSAFEALDNSLYALGRLIDELSGEQLTLAKKKFEQLMKIFDLQ
ncbi:MAG: helicase-related protein [Sphaerochaetaceae bacterium]